jgi:hypothetical protein
MKLINKIMKYIFAILTLTILFTGCMKESKVEYSYLPCAYGSNFIKMNDSSVMSDGLIPLSLISYWIYSDSVWKYGILQTPSFDTLRVVSAQKSGDETWWFLSDSYILFQKNDTVYKLSLGFVSAEAVSCPEKTKLFFPVTNDTIQNWNEQFSDYNFAGKAFLVGNTIATGSGNYSGCMEFTQHGFVDYTRIIKPGIGIVKTIEDDYNNKIKRIRTLVHYRIQ